MTVFIYVDTSKEVGDPDHLKVFANADAADTWLEENEPEGVAFESEMIGTFAGVWFALPACASKPQTGRRRPQLSFQELGPFLKTTRSVCDPLCLPLGLPCSFRPYWSGLSYRRMRHWLSSTSEGACVRDGWQQGCPFGTCARLHPGQVHLAAPTTDGVGNP
jgi:hypothetical protein